MIYDLSIKHCGLSVAGVATPLTDTIHRFLSGNAGQCPPMPMNHTVCAMTLHTYILYIHT